MLVGPRPALNALPTRGPPKGWGRPRFQETLLGAETAPSKGGPVLLGHREGGGVVVKPNNAGGSVGRARCRHRKVGSAAQQGWCPRPAIAGAYTVCA